MSSTPTAMSYNDLVYQKNSENAVVCFANTLSGGGVNTSHMKSDQREKQRMLDGSANRKTCDRGNSLKYHPHLVCHIMQKLLFSAKYSLQKTTTNL
jgi:hypothetical protein